MANKGDLIRANYENWNANRDVDPDVLADIGYATPENIDEVITKTLGRQAAGHTFAPPKSLTPKPRSRETPPDIPEGTIVSDWDPLQ